MLRFLLLLCKRIYTPTHLYSDVWRVLFSRRVEKPEGIVEGALLSVAFFGGGGVDLDRVYGYNEWTTDNGYESTRQK